MRKANNPSSHDENSSSEGITPRFLTPVPVPAHNASRKQVPLRRTSWWNDCISGLRYYSIQFRWDIERWVARRLHRRWGGR